MQRRKIIKDPISKYLMCSSVKMKNPYMINNIINTYWIIITIILSIDNIL